MPPRVKRRTGEDWLAEVRQLHRMRVAAELDVEAGARSEAWGELVRASVDALSLLLVTTESAEVQAIDGASRRLGEASQKRWWREPTASDAMPESC